MPGSGRASPSLSPARGRVAHQLGQPQGPWPQCAAYTGLPVKHFKATCPVRPVRLAQGSLLWHRRDIDQWFDTVKSGEVTETRDDVMGRL